LDSTVVELNDSVGEVMVTVIVPNNQLEPASCRKLRHLTNQRALEVTSS